MSRLLIVGASAKNSATIVFKVELGSPAVYSVSASASMSVPHAMSRLSARDMYDCQQ